MSQSQEESEPNNAEAELSWDISEMQKRGYLALFAQYKVYKWNYFSWRYIHKYMT